MKNKLLKFSLRRLFANKTFAVIFSVVASFAVWLVIMINQNPSREQVFTDVSASISLENTAAGDSGLGIVSDISKQKFTVTVSGPSYIVSALKPEDFTITADITNINSAGTFTLNMIGNRNSSKTGYNFVSISPSSINVSFDYIDTKEFPLEPQLIGVTATEGLIAEKPIVSNSEQANISIKGPRAIIEKIATVGSVAEVNKALDSTQSYESYVVIYDKNGEILYRYDEEGKVYDKSDKLIEDNNLTLSYTSVKITQPISKKKTVSIKPNFVNIPSGITEDNLKYTVDHSSVTVIGTPDIVDKMSSLPLEKIDFKDISLSSNVFEVLPDLPDGVKLLDKIESFNITVDTSAFKEKVFSLDNVKFEGLSSGLSAQLDAQVKNIRICGISEKIDALSEKDVTATVNLKDKVAGDYTVEITVKAGDGTGLWVFGSYTASITIK